MVSESVARTVLKFFFQSELDEPRALLLAERAIERFQRESQKSIPGRDEQDLLWSAIYLTWHRARMKEQSSVPIGFSFADWRVPSTVSLGPWLDFRRKSSRDEFFAVLGVEVMNCSVDRIARVCGVSVGSIRHRLSRGLRVLGQCLAEVQP